jgi:excisionase family DNA binding protein
MGEMMIPSVPRFEGKGGEENEAIPKGMALLAAEEKRPVVTVALAARLLGKSRDTIYRWMNEGRLAGRKVGGRWLVYRDSIEAEWRVGLVEPERE